MSNWLEVMLLVSVGFVLAILLTWLPCYFLWNWLMPQIFGLPELTMWQTLGVITLSSLLFKSTSSGSKS